MNIGSKFKIQKRYIAFFTLVPILALTALIKTPCPVCNGTGTVASTGMDEVEIISVEYHEQTRFLAGCDTYRVYQYEVNIVFENHSHEEAAGWVNMYLIDFTTGKLIDTRFSIAEVEPQSATENTFTVYFSTSVMVDQPKITEVKASIVKGDSDCKACNGHGKIAINSWPLVNELKDTYIDIQREPRPYMPPIWVETEGQAGIDY
ncbi:MAG: hypothetical protein PHQ10_06705 [Dehalococcoidales bacterium]|nr:hypothetical protein [Dehalococcoidales bacterium]MDD3265053.1 hypothetical protein [Dehalococcoidales bacterium]MDD4323168.1 hypothetical protein [Dehalococcoidales bacterium]MDD4794906.1 hypothetical protein [Dehalococcoidales bacterium]MDD5122908.1 hypothetical protein [Dehalococcoidales bacterium]